jgi:electron transport complex protein RnfD
MLDFCVALLPAAAVGFMRFGSRVLAVLAICVAAAVLSEFLAQKATKRPCTLGDFNVVYLGLLFGMLMPPTAPLWLPVVGVVFAVLIGKHFFGGIGTNPFNPVLLGWVVVNLSWGQETSMWVHPGANLATGMAAYAEAPLEVLHKFGNAFVADISTMDLLAGNVPGNIGVCAGAVLLGGLYLVARRRVSWIIPACFLIGIAGFATLAQSMGWGDASRMASPVFHLLAGSTMLGAFFLSTDYSASPCTLAGKVIFGLACGVMVMLIRIFGVWPDGVVLAIFVMSLLNPILDRIRPRVFGMTKEVRANA